MKRLQSISLELQDVLKKNNATMSEKIAVFSTALSAFLFNITDGYERIPEGQKEDFKKGTDFLEKVAMAALAADEEIAKQANKMADDIEGESEENESEN